MYDEFGRPAPSKQPVQVSRDAVLAYFGGVRKSKQVDAMANEIVSLNNQLQHARRAEDQYKRFLDHHGGMAVWDQDEILGRQNIELDRARKQAVEIEAKAQEIITTARVESQDTIQSTRLEAERILAEAHSEASAIRSRAEGEMLAAKERDLTELAKVRRQVSELKSEIPELVERVSLSSTALEDFSHPADSYIDLQGELRELRREIKKWVTGDIAVNSEFEVPDTPAKRNAMLKKMRKLALRCFNVETEQIIKSATASNAEAGLNKIYRAADGIQRLGAEVELSIDHDFQKLKARELELAVKAESARKLARDVAREHRAELKEQARIDAELEAQRARLEKEKAHYESILVKVEELGNDERALEIRHQLTEIESGIADVEYRQANQRAGYVYVISNIGSFGENVVKIGLTRRLDPMDRVKELGDASVPFAFDVHTLFFAEDAVGVEAELHRRFSKQRVNRINNRREFFYATPHEVREVLKDISGDLLEFVEVPEAEQYRSSIEIRQHEV